MYVGFRYHDTFRGACLWWVVAGAICGAGVLGLGFHSLDSHRLNWFVQVEVGRVRAG